MNIFSIDEFNKWYKNITSDDAFFNRNWAGACRGCWAGPGLLAGWDAGFLNCLG